MPCFVASSSSLRLFKTDLRVSLLSATRGLCLILVLCLPLSWLRVTFVLNTLIALKELFWIDMLSLDRHAPIQRRRLKSNPIPWLTPEIKKLMQVRDWHKKHAIKHNSSAYWELYKKLRHKVNSELRGQKSNYFMGKIKEHSQSNDIKGSWSLINSLLGRNKKMTNVTELIVDDVSIIDDRSIAESMNEYFISIGTKLADEIDSNSDYQNDDVTYANEFLESDSSSTNLFHFRTISVTSVALRLSKPLASKSTGMDNIPAKVLRITANIIAPSLTYIFNISLQSGIYVDDWKLAKIIPIYKSEDRKKCENYRPISILPVISKVYLLSFVETPRKFIIASQ